MLWCRLYLTRYWMATPRSCTFFSLYLAICGFFCVLHFLGGGWGTAAGEACAGWMDIGCEGIKGLCEDRSVCSR